MLCSSIFVRSASSGRATPTLLYIESALLRFAVLSTLILVGAVGASLDTNAEPQYTFGSALPLEELQ